MKGEKKAMRGLLNQLLPISGKAMLYALLCLLGTAFFAALFTSESAQASALGGFIPDFDLAYALAPSDPEDSTKNASAPSTGSGDTTNQTPKLRYPIRQDPNDPYGKTKGSSLDLKNPNAIDQKIDLDSSGQGFKISRSVGGEPLGDEKNVGVNEYLKDDNQSFVRDYFKKRSLATSNVIKGSTTVPNVLKNEGLLGDLFGGLVDIRPTGSAELIFAIDHTRIANPNWSVREQNATQFKFDQKIQLNVIGNIGNRIKLGISYNTETSFDFQNQKKLNYVGQEDEIIKSIELGNVSMPISNSLITGSQSLFGVKTRLQFGKLFVDGIYAQNQGEKKEILVENGAQKSVFNITADNYDVNRNFLLGHFFRDNFNRFNKNYPALSNVVITRIQVWVTNSQNTIANSRSVVGFMDLGEDKPFNTQFLRGIQGAYPDNKANNLYGELTRTGSTYRNAANVLDDLEKLKPQGLLSGQDYVKIDNARMLAATEYTVNQRLGYISLNFQPRPNDVIGVAFEYTINGQQYKVGDLAQDVPTNPATPNVLFLKLLKSNITYTRLPIWDLMMKNVYSLNTYQLQATDFKLQVIYEDNQSGSYLNYLPVPTEKSLDGIPLNRVLGLDRYNSLGELKPDGNFDFLENVTVTSSGRIIFPILEPFGNDLRAKFSDPLVASQYAYDSLYRSTRAIAIQQSNRNKFYLRGTYQGASGSDIALNAINVPQGSVKVFAGAAQLQENVDFTVDYTLGRVRIINPSIIASGSVVRVQLESNSLFSIQQKTLMGGRAEYKFNKDLYVGGTFLYLRERPLTPKVNVGDEPIRNSIFGLDGSYSTESRFLTNLVDKLPFYSTKEKSTFFVKGEYAEINPGHPKLLNDPSDPNATGVSYLDDFEAAEVPYDLRLGNYWVLSSTPEGVSKLPEGYLTNNLQYNFNRAKLAWYTIDPLFFRNNSITPTHIKADRELQSDHYQREVIETELFPNKQLPSGVPGTLQTFDLSYWPDQRGPYNFNYKDLMSNGRLNNPASRWAGIMRRIETSDFEAANIQYVEFWLLDPFIDKPNNQGGEMYIQLGNLSEDILRDRQKSYENGLPKAAGDTSNTNKTAWGRVSSLQQINSAFETDPTARKYQDVGYDGLGPVGDDGDERAFFKQQYLDQIEAAYGKNSQAYINADNDPSNDNFHFYTGNDYDDAKVDIIHRYKRYNNVQGNTPIANGGPTTGYGTPNPDDEDINRDFTLNPPPEQYFEYKMSITPDQLPKTATPNLKNYITNVLQVPVTLKNGKIARNVTWYQFKVPINEYTRRQGTITDFRSIQFMRIFLTGFKDSVTMRFGQLQLVRGEWRPYLFNLQKPGEIIPVDDRNTEFTLSSVNLERNGNRRPPYVTPPGIQRTIDVTTPDQIQQNEQSLALHVCNLQDGDARSVFKNTTFDVRLYKHLKMFVHAEGATLRDNDATVFVRIGTDLSSNFYEYEMPLKVTPLSSRSKDEIWPAANNINITLADLYNAKATRNSQRLSLQVPYYAGTDGKSKITVLGNPDLSNIKTIMIGIRNPKDDNNPDGRPICGDFWVNELRITDFDEQGGWAANATVRAKLADLAVVTGSVQRRTVGFGSLEQTVQQRSQKDTKGFDVSVALDLDKLLPKKLFLKIPVYYTYGELINRPRFNPLTPDLPFDNVVNSYAGDSRKQDSVIKANEDYTARTSLNFNNVSKLRNPNKKSTHIYDIENFYLTFSYGEIYKRSLEKVYDIDRSYKAVLGYSYNFKAKNVQPFKNLAKGKYGKLTQLISDFNFFYLPQSWAASIEGNRRYGEILYRNTDNYKAIIEPLYDKAFKLDRRYDFRYNLTKSIRLTYSANANSYVPEPFGRIDNREKRNVLWDSLKTLGKQNTFNQVTAVTYDVPISKVPYLDWTQLQTTYTGNYTWQRSLPATPQFGNTISNSATEGANLQLNFATLYNKSPYLRNIISGKGNAPQAPPPPPEDNTPGKKKTSSKKKSKRKTPVKRSTKLNEQNATKEAQAADSSKNKKPEVNTGLVRAGDVILRIVTSLRTASLSYTQSDGTTLPGFLPVPTYLGMSYDTNRDFRSAPGLGFVFGSQKDIRALAKQKGWITKDTNLSSFYLRSHTVTLNGQATLEPFKNFRISLDFFKRESQAFQENFRVRGSSGTIEEFGGVTTGSFSISALPIFTSFSPNATFKNFESLDNRNSVAKRLAEGNPRAANRVIDSTGFPTAFHKNSQEVLLYSFLAAYNGTTVNKVALSPFRNIPMPNWRINYTGLTNFDFVKQYAKSVNINHAYRATYTVGNYISALNYSTDSVARNGQNLRPKLIIDNVSMQEDFSPLLGIDISWLSNWTSRLEYRKSRTLSLAFTNLQLSENRTEELVIGAGYRTNKFLLPFKINRRKYYLTNDLNMRLDFSIRDNRTQIRVLDQGTSQSSAGQLIYSFKPAIDYALSKSLLVKIFWTTNITQPHVSTQYPTSNTNAGFSLRYTITP